MSDSVRPHRRQPTSLRHPWDSPGKNIGVGCHFLLQCKKVKTESDAAQSCPTLNDPMNAAHQAPPSMGFSWQEYWSRVPLPSQATSYCVVYLLKLSQSLSPHLINQDNNTHGLMKMRLYRACKRAWLIVVEGLVAQSYLNLCDHCPPTPWTAARQAPLDYGVLRQEY